MTGPPDPSVGESDLIAPRELLAQIQAGSPPAILDVRSRQEYRRGHVPGALHVPFWMIRWRLRRVPGARDNPVVVYCGHGPRAWIAGAALRRRGFRGVKYLAGHFKAWREGGFVTESGR